MQEHAGLRAIATNGAISVVFVAPRPGYILEAGPYKGTWMVAIRPSTCRAVRNGHRGDALACPRRTHAACGLSTGRCAGQCTPCWLVAPFVLNVIHRDQSACRLSGQLYDSPAYHEPGLLAVYLAVGITQVAIYVLSFPFALRRVMTLSWRT